MSKKIDMATQMRILAKIARKDTYAQISEGEGLAIATIQSIKERNTGALDAIKDKLVTHEVTKATELLDKSQRLLNKKLDRAAQSHDQTDEIREQFVSGEIDVETYRAKLSSLYDISVTELNAIQREAFHQSQIEAGKPTTITSGNAREELMALAEAMKRGDDIELYKMVLKPNREGN